ncbi:MAG: hypothetical protein DRO67_02675 [Candidatus Asgardarchaeum californiense]|nr:MAG: hypothetical protein DRO67_02675 [Candidatus Asgardarchaeum californiense]
MTNCENILARGERSEKSGVYETAVQAYYEAAECFRQLRNNKKYSEMLKRIIKLRDKKGKSLFKDYKLLPAGIVYYYSGLAKQKLGIDNYHSDFDLALKTFAEGIEYYRNNKQFLEAARCSLELGHMAEVIKKDRATAMAHYARAAELYADAGEYMDAIAMIDEAIKYYSEIGDIEKVDELKAKLHKYIDEGIFTLSNKGDHNRAALLALRVAKDDLQKNNIKAAIEMLYKSLDEFINANNISFAQIVFLSLAMYYTAEKNYKKLDTLINDYADDIISTDTIALIQKLKTAVSEKDISLFGMVLSEIKNIIAEHPVANYFFKKVASKLPTISISLSAERDVLPIAESEIVTVRFENPYESDVVIENSTLEATSNVELSKTELSTPIRLKKGAVYMEAFEVKALENGMAEIMLHSEIKIKDQKYKLKTPPLKIKVPALKPDLDIQIDAIKQLRENVFQVVFKIKNVGAGRAKDIMYQLYLPDNVIVGKGFIKDSIEKINVDESQNIDLNVIVPSKLSSFPVDIKIIFKDEDENEYSRSLSLNVVLKKEEVSDENMNDKAWQQKKK